MTVAAMGMAVHANDGPAGRIDDVLLSSETGQPAYLVIDAGGFFKGDVVVGIEKVTTIDETGVWLSLSREEVKHSSTYDAARYGASSGFMSQASGRYGES